MLSCVKCGAGSNIQVCHIRKFTDGGTGLKPSPWFVLPMCDRCHAEQHLIGELSFWGGADGVYNAIDWAGELYRARNDVFEAREIVIKARVELL